MRYVKTISLLVFILADFIQVSAQADSLTFYPVNNPLLQQYDIRQITATKDGKLWLSTANGLLSYDGNDIRIYSHDSTDNTSLSGNIIAKSVVDGKGNLFVLLSGEQENSKGQIDYFNTKTGKAERFTIKIEREDSSEYYPTIPFSSVYIDSDSTLLAGRTNMGFIRYNLKNRKTVGYSLRSVSNTTFNTVYAIHKDIRDNNLVWLATNNGIYSFNCKTNQLQRNFRCIEEKDSTDLDLDILDIHVRTKDTIWFVTYIRGLGCYDIKTGKYTIFPRRRMNEEAGKIVNEEDRFHTLGFQFLNKDQYLIAITGRPPWIFDITTHNYIFYSKIVPVFPVLYFNQSVIDDFGNIWCLFYKKLYKATPKKIKLGTATIFDKYYQDRRENTFKTVIWDEKKKLYYVAVSLGDGVFVFDENMQFIKTIPAPRTNDPQWGLIEPLVIDIALDKNRRLWMCSSMLCVYDSLQDQIVPAGAVFPGLKSTYQRFRNFVFRGNWCYALPGNASSQYLYRININSLTCDSIHLSAVPVAEKQPPNQLGTLEMDSKGENMYISNKNAVFQYNLITGKTKKVTELTDTDKPYAYWANFHWYNVDDDDNLWVSSINKTWIFEPVNLKVIKMFEREKNTYFNQAYNIKGKGVMCYVNSTSYYLYDYKNNKQYKITINDGLNSYLNWSTASVNGMLFVGAYHYFQYIPLASVITKKKERRCYLSDIRLFDRSYKMDTLPEYLHSLKLPHNKNFISFTFSSTEFDQPEALEYRYKLEGINNDWVYVNYLNRTVSYTNLNPGGYTFYASVKNDDGTWSSNSVNIQISIIPAWWQTNWFKTIAMLAACCLIILLIQLRIKTVRGQERQRSKIEKEMLELEAKALRAQMNPHFIFNCLNSIKSLIQEHKEDKSVTYLTTFSKLIRTLFNNADKKEISLYDEIETCKLYLQLEAMRFDTKFSYSVGIDAGIDLKSVQVPALIIQPFIENAIWHGIVPKGASGHVDLSVKQKDNSVEIIIDDNGIGRKASEQNKPASNLVHQSKGVSLTQSRLELDNLLQQRQATLEIIDKKNENGTSAGTKVIIRFNEQLS